MNDLRCIRCGGTGREPDWKREGRDWREVRTQRGWTLRDLAKRAKVSAAYLSDLELGRRAWQADGAQRVMRALESKP